MTERLTCPVAIWIYHRFKSDPRLEVSIMGKETIDVIIDDREPEDLIVEFSQHDEVNDWRVDRLDEADIQFEHPEMSEKLDILIERKGPGDYNGSLTGGRLYDQCERMQETTDNPFVLVEGDIGDLYDREYGELPPSSIRGSMASIMIRNKVPIVPVQDQEGLVDLAVRLARKTIEDSSRSSLNTGPVDRAEPVAKRFFGLVPSVGPSTAESLYAEFETVEEALSASEEDFQEIEGIGPKTAQKINEALR